MVPDLAEGQAVIRAWLALVSLLRADCEIAAREYYGGICELRIIELEVDGVWYETNPVACERPRRRQ